MDQSQDEGGKDLVDAYQGPHARRRRGVTRRTVRSHRGDGLTALACRPGPLTAAAVFAVVPTGADHGNGQGGKRPVPAGPQAARLDDQAREAAALERFAAA